MERRFLLAYTGSAKITRGWAPHAAVMPPFMLVCFGGRVSARTEFALPLTMVPSRSCTRDRQRLGLAPAASARCDFPHREARGQALLSCTQTTRSNGHDFFPAEPEGARNTCDRFQAQRKKSHGRCSASFGCSTIGPAPVPLCEGNHNARPKRRSGARNPRDGLC